MDSLLIVQACRAPSNARAATAAGPVLPGCIITVWIGPCLVLKAGALKSLAPSRLTLACGCFKLRGHGHFSRGAVAL